MVENKFGELICKLRKEMNLTQKELADKINISDKAISRWETGKNFPTIEMLYTISKFFKIPFQDLLTARMVSGSGEDKDDVFPEIVKEFNSMNKRKLRRFKIALIVTLVVTIYFVSAYFFTQSYNRFKVYDVVVQSEDLTYVKGTYVETRIKDLLSLNNLNNLAVSDDDSVSVDIYYVEDDKENIIRSYSNLDNISFSNTQSYIKIDDLSKYLDKLYLRVRIINKNNEIKEYIGQLEFTENFSNNKIYVNDKVDVENNDNNNDDINLTSEEIETILLKNGFEELYDNFYCKEGSKYKIYFYLDTNKIEYYYEENNFYYKYNYNMYSSILLVNIFDDNNTEIENYKYDVKNNQVIECITGSCKNYKEAMNKINKDFLDLLK